MKLTNKLFSLFAVVSFSFWSYAQSDNPCGAPSLTVNSTCSFQGGTNAGATATSGVPAPGCANYSGGDVWYTATVPANGTITVDMNSGVITDAGMAIYSGSCGALVLVECDDDDSANGFMSMIALTGQTPGATLWIRVWEYGNDNNGSFSICASSPIPPPALTNDDPCSAITIPVNSNCSYTQYTNAGATASAGVPAPGCANYSGGDVWFEITVPASGDVNFDMNTGDITDAGMAVYSGVCSSLTLIECDDDDSGNGAMAAISLTGQTPGATLWIRVWEYGNDNNGTFSICAQEPGPPPTNVNCSIPDPICSGSPITFTAQANGTEAETVNPGNDYDCLLSSPNPSWFYLEVATGGNLAIDLTAGSDIDFELWGPFPNLANAIGNCDSYGTPTDCSFSTSPTEEANANGVLAGEVYVLLVTNFANTVQSITVADAPGNTATTDCSIVTLSVELTEFDGNFNDDMSEVELTWSTSSERDNSHFVVEKSIDTKQWSGVGLQTGSGTTTHSTDYTMVDSNPYSGESYYRLKQFDFDGKMTISDIIQVNRTIENKIQLYPNPTKDAVSINSNNEILNVNIVDIQGSIVYNQNQVLQKMVRIDLSNLTEGMYYAQIETDKGISIERISVIK